MNKEIFSVGSKRIGSLHAWILIGVVSVIAMGAILTFVEQAHNGESLNLLVEAKGNIKPSIALVCSPQSQTASIGDLVNFSASGGGSTYSWTATGGTPSSGSGVSFSTRYSRGGSYTVSVKSGGKSATCSVTISDITPPSVPAGLTATPMSSSQIKLSWKASTDNVGVAGYKVYRNGSQIGTTKSTVLSFSDVGLSASTAYSYTVAAYDAAGNVSAQSMPASVTTLPPPDTTPPSVPTGLTATASSSSRIDLSWSASTDNVGVAGYKVYRNGVLILSTAATIYSDTGLSAYILYTYAVAAYDAAGNVSAQSMPASAATKRSLNTSTIYPKGSYAMLPSTTPLSSAMANDYGLTGILLQTTWNQIEPQQGVYDWSKVDARIQEAQNAGLAVVLKIALSPSVSPSWLKSSSSVQTISFVNLNQYQATYCQAVAGPVFWDPMYVSEKIKAIQAAGARYATNPNVVSVLIASFANWNTDDWFVPHVVGYQSDCGGIYVDQVQQWLDAGYTTAKMLAVGKQVIDATAAAFPTQAIKLPIAVTDAGLDGTATTLAEDIINYAYAQPYGNRFYAQENRLNTTKLMSTDPSITGATPGSEKYIYRLLSQHSPQIGLQMTAGASTGSTDGCRQNGGTSPCPPDQVLQTSVNIGLSYHPTFLEYWEVDGENPLLYPIIANTSAKMQ